MAPYWVAWILAVSRLAASIADRKAAGTKSGGETLSARSEFGEAARREPAVGDRISIDGEDGVRTSIERVDGRV